MVVKLYYRLLPAPFTGSIVSLNLSSTRPALIKCFYSLPGAGFESTGLAGLLFRNLRIRVIKI